MNDSTKAQGTPAGLLRTALDQALHAAPGFLRGDVDADQMAHTMVRAARSGALAPAPDDGADDDPQTRALRSAVHELQVCGSGYLAGRCDAACVARTMTYMLHTFGAQQQQSANRA